uniref:Uncharacterized protein n=1 Tax=Photinus pyralis TaxID=7054 RepID=A0A1Y1M6Z7_PHOPY
MYHAILAIFDAQYPLKKAILNHFGYSNNTKEYYQYHVEVVILLAAVVYQLRDFVLGILQLALLSDHWHFHSECHIQLFDKWFMKPVRLYGILYIKSICPFQRNPCFRPLLNSFIENGNFLIV